MRKLLLGLALGLAAAENEKLRPRGPPDIDATKVTKIEATVKPMAESRPANPLVAEKGSEPANPLVVAAEHKDLEALNLAQANSKIGSYSMVQASKPWVWQPATYPGYGFYPYGQNGYVSNWWSGVASWWRWPFGGWGYNPTHSSSSSWVYPSSSWWGSGKSSGASSPWSWGGLMWPMFSWAFTWPLMMSWAFWPYWWAWASYFGWWWSHYASIWWSWARYMMNPGYMGYGPAEGLSTLQFYQLSPGEWMFWLGWMNPSLWSGAWMKNWNTSSWWKTPWWGSKPSMHSMAMTSTPTVGLGEQIGFGK